jgi:hypothetical protein
MPITSEQLRPWQRRLIPGITEILFAVLALWQFERDLFADADSGWHLWAGMDVLAHGPRAIPDALSFTRAGALWRNPEWLSDAIFALLYRHAGYFGVSLFVALLFAGLFAWLYRVLVRETGSVPAALLATIFAAVLASLQVLARPVVFALVLVGLSWDALRVPGRERRAVWLVPLLTVLWANLHPSAFLAPALGLFAWLARGRDRRLALATLLSIAALAATPWGIGWMRDLVPRGDNLLLFRNIDEWRSPDFHDRRSWLLLAYLLLALIARRAGPRPVRGETLLGLGCLAGSLLAIRVAALAVILWAPVLARDLSGWGRERGGWLFGRAWRAMQDSFAPFERAFRPGLWPALAAIVLLAFAPQLPHSRAANDRGFPAALFPYRAMARADSLRLGPRVLNSYGWGGYLSWVYGGRWKVFIDGRAGFYGGDALRDYVRLMLLEDGWTRALERWRPDWMLIDPKAPLVEAAPLTGRWRVAYRDSMAVILTPVRGPHP